MDRFDASRMEQIQKSTGCITFFGPEKLVSLALSGDGCRVYAGDTHGNIYEWIIENKNSHPHRVFTGHKKRVTALVANETSLFSASEDASVKVWDLESGNCTRSVNGHSGAVLSICITSEGRLYTGGIDKTINEWDPWTGRRQWIMTGSEDVICALACSPSCPKTIFSAGNDATIRCWDTTSGRCVMKFEGHSDSIVSLVVHGMLVFSGSLDGTIKMWNAQDGSILSTFLGHGSIAVNSLCFLNNSLFSAGESKHIVRWNFERGHPESTINGHSGSISTIVAHQDRSAIVSASFDGTVKLWPIDNHRPSSN